MMKYWFPYLLHNALVSICFISRWNRKPLWAKYDFVNSNNIHGWFNPSLNTMMLTYFINWYLVFLCHNYNDVIMGTMASQITSLTIVCSVVHSMWPENFPHKWPVTRKMFPFDDVIMTWNKKFHVTFPVDTGFIKSWASAAPNPTPPQSNHLTPTAITATHTHWDILLTCIYKSDAICFFNLHSVVWI